MSILCGTDFSAPAAEAARAAAALAQAWGEPLRLVHVIDLFDGDSLPEEASRQLLQERAEELELLAVSLRAATGARVDCEVRRGIVDVELTQLAAESKARLLVVAAIGHRREPRWLLGSVAERIARATPPAWSSGPAGSVGCACSRRSTRASAPRPPCAGRRRCRRRGARS
jgi:nucleotide-binding universal stress UspA family protein